MPEPVLQPALFTHRNRIFSIIWGQLGPVSDRARPWLGQETGHSSQAPEN